MKLAHVMIEWGVDSAGQHVVKVSDHNSQEAVSGFADTSERAWQHLIAALPKALKKWAERDLAREAFAAGSSVEPGRAMEAFDQWWCNRLAQMDSKR